MDQEPPDRRGEVRMDSGGFEPSRGRKVVFSLHRGPYGRVAQLEKSNDARIDIDQRSRFAIIPLSSGMDISCWIAVRYRIYSSH